MGAKKRPGAPRKYKSARALEQAIESYWAAISYQKPVIISTPTGEVDKNGNVKHVTRMLTEDEDGRLRTDGLGKPRTAVEYIEEPSVAALCVRLNISKETWSEYARSEDLGPVCARFKLRLESYLLSKLDGNRIKTVQGVIFNLQNNFEGYRERREVEAKGDSTIRVELTPELGQLAE